jgi:hypothetical protein
MTGKWICKHKFHIEHLNLSAIRPTGVVDPVNYHSVLADPDW